MRLSHFASQAWKIRALLRFKSQIWISFGFCRDLYAFSAENFMEAWNGRFAIIGFWPAAASWVKVPLVLDAPLASTVYARHLSSLRI